MPVTIIDTLTPKNNGSFPIALANDLQGGIHSVDEIDDMYRIQSERLLDGMLCYVKNDRLYQYIDKRWKEFVHGSIIADTYSELSRVITNDIPLGTIAYVISDENNRFIYYLSAGGWKSIDQSNVWCYIGDTEPDDKSMIWFDTSDEEVETMYFPEEQTLKDFQQTANKMLNKTIEIESKVNHLKGGTFYNEDTSDKTSGGNYLNFSIKTGSSKNLRQLSEGELVYCSDTNELWIGVRKNPNQSTITNVCIMSGGTIDPEPEWDGYVELTSNANVKYRLLAGADGRIRLHEASYYEANDPAVTEATRFKGLIINRVFGGGALNADVSPVSHGFIELYNNSSEGLPMNLKGLSLHYKTKSDSVWQKLELEGYLPFQTSFLVRCARHTSDYSANCRLKIKEYDMDWKNVAIADGGFSVYLSVGRDVLLVQNPFNYNDTGLKAEGYIDLIALGKEGVEDSVNAYEGTQGYYPNFGNSYTGCQRIDFADTDNNFKDIEKVNYRNCDVNIYKPRCSTDGEWDLYYNKIKLNERIPNMINICYGQEVTTRTFTWQSVVTDIGYLRYRKANTTEWTYVESERDMITNRDCDATVHRAIIRNLEYTTYEYQAGEDGAWSDLSTFEVIEHGVTDETDHVKFLQVSDQQGWNKKEYDAWKWAIKYIEETEPSDDYEFVYNSGDISQNGNQAFEQRWYYKYPLFNKTKCHMASVGNNDLVDKVYSYLFKRYQTFENEAQIETDSLFPVATCNSWDIGFVHFVNMNTNVAEDTNLMIKQFNWIKTDMEQARARTNPPRWFVLLGHHGALSVTRMKSPQQMIPFVEDLGFDVVIFGHHHSYSRSKPVLMNIKGQVETTLGKSIYEATGTEVQNAVYGIGYLEAGISGVGQDQTTAEGNAQSAIDYINEKNGIYWVMCQATGFKLNSNKDMEKTPTPWWYGYTGDHPYDPSYIMWDFGFNEIKLKSIGVTGIMIYDAKLKAYTLKDNIKLEDLGQTIWDEVTITHKSLR